MAKGTAGAKGKAEDAPRERVARTSASLVDDRLGWLHREFPEAFGEGDRINFDLLRTALGSSVEDERERYRFGWAGKQDAVRLLQLPSHAALIPDPEQSIDFAATHNLFLEGENLEVLKLLYKPYFGRVKMIYIDPPYNTGNDFVYEDNFADPLEQYLVATCQKDDDGNLLTSKPETSGRFHSSWLSMMYPRLFIARQLLRDDGVIFISIDDHELHNLRMLMNETFGEENFLGCVVRATGTTTGQDSRGFGSSFDYMLCYSKSAGYELGGIPLSEKDEARFNQEDARGKYSLLQLRKTGNNDRREDRPLMYYPVKAPDGSEVFPVGPTGYESCWRVGPTTYERLLADDMIVWKETTRNGDGWAPYVKYYLEGREKRPSPLWTDLDGNKKATIEVKELLGDKVFTGPKPTAMIRRLLEIATEPDTGDIVLDFFAGSGTTAHAVLAQNCLDNGNRRFICVQLPEQTPENSPAQKAGYKDIAAIGRARIRRVIEKLHEDRSARLELEEAGGNALGFRAFALRPSNFKAWKGVDDNDPDKYIEQMEAFADALVDGWTAEGLIWEVAVKEGFSLSCSVEPLTAKGTKTLWRFEDRDADQHFTICLDDEIPADLPGLLKLDRDDLFICRDSALTDELAANLTLQCHLKTL